MTRLLPHLLDVSIRSAALAMVAVALLRIRALRTAAWAHAIWTVVLLSMLLLFIAGSVFKPIPLRILPAPRASVAEQSSDLVSLPSRLAWEISVPSGRRTVPAPAQPRSLTAGRIAVWVYVTVAMALLARLVIGSWLARRLFAESVRAGESFYESRQITIPLTIGWLRPVILLPVSWRTWDDWKLKAVLLHESSHVLRRDSLISLLAGLNHCLLWFHPLAWWLERKIAFLAERACDEACVCRLENRSEYARLLVEMAGAVEVSRGRLFAHSLLMARPSQIHERVEALLDDNRIVHRGLNAFSWAAALTCGIMAVSAAGTMTIEPKLPRPQVPLMPAVAMPAPLGIQPPRPSLPGSKPFLVAQAPADVPTPTQPDVINAQTQIVLPVSVVDPSGRYVTGLASTNFRITEGADARPITAFHLADGQHAIAILNTIGATAEALDAFQKVLDPRDESFKGDGPPAANTEAFLDRIAVAVSEAKQKPNPIKAVVVIMQGGRNNPLAPEKNVANVLRLAVRAPRVALFFANLEDVSEAVPLSFASSQQDDIRILASATGGMVFPVARPEEMATAITRIGAMLRYQYLLGFVRSNLSDGLAKPNIEIVNSPGLPRLQVIGPQAYMQ
jgi:beta-lactamase regulating signal transducer with metallopeptidase domain